MIFDKHENLKYKYKNQQRLVLYTKTCFQSQEIVSDLSAFLSNLPDSAGA